MRLPNAAFAVIPDEKITKYLLMLGHPTGDSKAKFFIGYGFALQDWQVLRDALWSHGQQYEVASTLDKIDPDRTHYAIQGPLVTPNGAKPNVRTVWCIWKGRHIPHLVTAVPV